MSLNPSGQLCSNPAAITLVTLNYPQVRMASSCGLAPSLMCVCVLQEADLPLLIPAGNPVTFNYYDNYVAAIGATLTLLGNAAASSIVVTEEVKGTRISSGMNATSLSVGAVYIFAYNTHTATFNNVRGALPFSCVCVAVVTVVCVCARMCVCLVLY